MPALAAEGHLHLSLDENTAVAEAHFLQVLLAGPEGLLHPLLLGLFAAAKAYTARRLHPDQA